MDTTPNPPSDPPPPSATQSPRPLVAGFVVAILACVLTIGETGPQILLLLFDCFLLPLIAIRLSIKPSTRRFGLGLLLGTGLGWLILGAICGGVFK